MTEVAHPTAAGARRGAPRSEAARHAILAATADLLASRGWDRLTVEGIAAAAGVGKQTIYRWWPTRAAIVAECLREGMLLPAELVPPDTGDVRADLTGWLDSLFRFVDAPEARPMLAALLDEVLGGSSLLTRRLQAAVDAGDLPPGVRARDVADALVGVVVLHVLRRAPADPTLAPRLARLLLH